MNKFFFIIFFTITHNCFAYEKKIHLPPLVVIQVNQLLNLSVDKFYKESLASKGQFKGSSLSKIQKVIQLLLGSAKTLPPETAVHFKKIFQALDVQLSSLIKTAKPIYIKQVWKSLFLIARSFNVNAYLYGFCDKDRSMWIQKKKSKLINPIGARSCAKAI
ncbi:MAG: hypothetical protein HAW63_02325 [Bdellovibrionaceae bacterium]|nr:hypothetical protein [Pseudobdellovibrionaceae bacterium]